MSVFCHDISPRHSVEVFLNPLTFCCETTVKDKVEKVCINKSLTLDELNRSLDFLMHHQHQHALKMIDILFPQSVPVPQTNEDLPNENCQ